MSLAIRVAALLLALLFTVPAQAGSARLSLEDRSDIETVLAKYALALDNNDWDTYAQIFTADAVMEFANAPDGTNGPAMAGLKTITGYMSKQDSLKAGKSDHHTLNTVIWRDEGGAVRAWSTYLVTRADGTLTHGEYLDLLVSTKEGWRIKYRRGNNRTMFGAQPRAWYGAWWLSGGRS
jgi:hypothetical protein